MQQHGEMQLKSTDQSAGASEMAIFELDRYNALAHAIVATIREPLIILDRDLRIVAASGSFCRLFQVEAAAAQACPLYELNGGQWNLPGLRRLLEDVFTSDMLVEGYKFEMDVPRLGRRRMLLNARLVLEQEASDPALLVALEDVTACYEADLLLVQHKTRLLEIQHRVANSLQIIASILMLKIRAVDSEETRHHLRDAHQRVMAVAAMQQQLRESDAGGRIEIRPYLLRLCNSLAASMISEDRNLAVCCTATDSTSSSSNAVSLGLIVTELTINALKHGFPGGREGRITVDFVTNAAGWQLSVSDNGVGRSAGKSESPHIGLGTSIVEALGRQMKARIEIGDEPPGTQVAIIHDASIDDDICIFTATKS